MPCVSSSGKQNFDALKRLAKPAGVLPAHDAGPAPRHLPPLSQKQHPYSPRASEWTTRGRPASPFNTMTWVKGFNKGDAGKVLTISSQDITRDNGSN